MAFGTITVTESTFGSISGTVVGAIPGTLSGSVGVPGPQGPTGPQGPQGPAGQGVPAGGTAGQFLTKTTTGVDYATDWTTLDVSAKRDLTDYDFTNVWNTRLNVYGLTINPLSGTTIPYDSYLNDSTLSFSYDASNGGTVEGVQLYCQYTDASFFMKRQDWANVDGDMIATLQYGAFFDPANGLKFINWNGTTQASTMQYGRTSITFPDASVQTIAFPGFANAALTGNPTAPTPPTADNDTSIATTAFVKSQGYATLASPIFTGNPTAPTAALGDNDTSIATTAFVQQELASGTAVAKNLEVRVRNQSGSTMAAGTIVYISGAMGNLPLITKAQANNDANSAQTIGFVKTSIANNGTGYVIVRGELENIDTSALSEGAQLYLSPTTAGTWTTTKPSAPEHLVYVGVVIRSHPTQGVILVSVQNGFEVAELHDSAISSPANNDLFVYELSTDLWKNKSFSTLGLATLASPTFTGTPSLPMGTTAVTQSAGNNTTALATTAFVQQEVPAASTTAAGKVELATDAEVIAGTSTTLALVPGRAGFLLTDPRLRSLAAINGSSIQGSGLVTASSGHTFGREMYLNSLATGRANWNYGLVGQVGFGTSLANRRRVDFSKKIWMSGQVSFGMTGGGIAYTGDSNTMCRITLGGYSTVGGTTGDMTLRGIGLKKVGGVSSVVTLTVHNGTTLTDVATTTTVADGAGINWVIYSDGTGNVTLYIDGVQAATTSAGPTGTTGENAGCYREQVEATSTPGVRQAMNIGAGGGWIYFEG